MPGVALNVPHLVNIVMIVGDLFMAEFTFNNVESIVFYFKRCPVCNHFNETTLGYCVKCNASLKSSYQWGTASITDPITKAIKEKING